MTKPFPAALAALAALAISACCVSCASSKGGKPTAICGKTVSRDPAEPVVEDATSHDVTVTGTSSEGLIFLRTASGCHTGADVTVEPGDAADIVDTVPGSDKRDIAVVLQPHRDAFTVRVTRSPSSVSVVTVRGLSLQPATDSTTVSP